MSHTPARLLVPMLAALVVAAPAQIVDAYLPDPSPSTGVAANSIPFNPAFGATPGAFTQMIVVSATHLAAQGLQAGAELVDVRLAPCGSGTLVMPSFRAAVGHLQTPYPTPLMAGAFVQQTVLYDSDATGPFSWNVVGGQWCSFGLGGGGFMWDGVSDVGFYTTHQGLSLSSASGWPGTFWRGGSAQRLYAPGFDSSVASVTSASALKIATTWAVGADAYAYAAPYGQGASGSFGAPYLWAVGDPQFGNANFAVGLSNAPVGLPALLVASAQPLDLPIGAGGASARLLVDVGPASLLGLFPATVDATGSASLAFPLGAYDAALAGLHVFAQWFVFGDPQGTPTVFGFSVAATAGLDLRIGV